MPGVKGAQQAGGGKWDLFSGPENDSTSSHTLLSQGKLRLPVRISVLRLFLFFSATEARAMEMAW